VIFFAQRERERYKATSHNLLAEPREQIHQCAIKLTESFKTGDGPAKPNAIIVPVMTISGVGGMARRLSPEAIGQR